MDVAVETPPTTTQAAEANSTPAPVNNNNATQAISTVKTEEKTTSTSPPPPPAPPAIVRVPVKHANLGIRSHAMDMSTMVELTSFSTLGKIQPFLVTISTTAAVIVDLHCHLSDKEVCGYLGGHWDVNSHNLTITGAFPCRYSGKDKTAAAVVENEIARVMEWKRVNLVGWYHSHPKTHASPSLRDVDSQLDYEIKMKGASDNNYTPCVGLVCAPYSDSNCYEPNFNVFWSLPPPENRPHEYPRPMLLSYSLAQEPYIPQDALDEMKKCVDYYKTEANIDFTAKINGNVTYLDRLKISLASKLPGRNRTSNGSYWDVIREMICPGLEESPSTDPFLMKFPMIPSVEALTSTGMSIGSTNVFLTPMNFKPEGSSTPNKHYSSQPSTSKENSKSELTIGLESPGMASLSNNSNNSSMKRHSSDPISSFQSGELTVSVKNAKHDYDYDFQPTDFAKIPNPLSADTSKMLRNAALPDFPLADITQQITKFTDLSKLANFTTSDLAKLSSFSMSDFTRSPAYARNIASLFGPLGKMSPAKDLEGNDYPEIPQSYKQSTSVADLCRSALESNKSERESSDHHDSQKQKSSEETIIKPDFGAMLDMTIHHSKKQAASQETEESLNLSKDR